MSIVMAPLKPAEPVETPSYSPSAYLFWERHHYGSLDAAMAMMNELGRMREGCRRAYGRRKAAPGKRGSL